MSFNKVKATAPELDNLKKKRIFSKKGEDLLSLKREQVLNSLKDTLGKFISKRKEMSKKIFEDQQLLERAFETIGERNVDLIATQNKRIKQVVIDVNFVNKMGEDTPEIVLHEEKKTLPSYSLTNTGLEMDILIRNLGFTLKTILKLAELDSMIYHFSDNFKKIEYRINALENIIVPKLERDILTIEEILEDIEREEFIRMKKIKEFLESK